MILAVKVALPAFLPLTTTLLAFFLLRETTFLPALVRDHVVFLTFFLDVTLTVFFLPTVTVTFFVSVGFLAAASEEVFGAIPARLKAITTAIDFARTDLILFFKTLTSYFLVLFWFLFVKHASRFRRKQLLQHDYLYSGYFSGFALISLSVGFVFSFQSLLNTKDFNSYTCSGLLASNLLAFNTT